jgi:hypothetical protein
MISATRKPADVLSANKTMSTASLINEFNAVIGISFDVSASCAMNRNRVNA